MGENLEAVVDMAKGLGLRVDIIGKVGGDIFKLNDIEMKIDRVQSIYFNSFKEVVEQDI